MKRYIVAAGQDYYPGILEDDWKGIYDTEEEARKEADRLIAKVQTEAKEDWVAVVEVDITTMTFRRVMRYRWGRLEG